MDKKTRIIMSVVSMAILTIGTVIGIFLVQGYTINTKEKKVIQTGVLVVNSVPNGAQIIIDDHPTNVTNTSINYLPSKKYNVRLTKEGYTPWQKDINIDTKIISEIEAILWPATPSINPITNSGVLDVHISPDNQKLAYAIKYSEKDKAGLWVLDMAKRTVFSGTSTDFSQVAKNTNKLDFSTAQLQWSPDSKLILATLQEENKPDAKSTRNFLLDITKVNSSPVDITLTKDSTLQQWLDEWNTIQSERLAKLQTDVDGLKLASESAIPLRWSLDETMFMYAQRNSKPEVMKPSSQPKVVAIKTATQSANLVAETETVSDAYKRVIESQFATFSADLDIKVYDRKRKKSFDIPWAKHITWYPAEEKADREIQHLVLVEDDQIAMVESDGNNKTTIYSGPFVGNTVFPWPDGGRLVILTNFNAKAGSEPNLYTINLR